MPIRSMLIAAALLTLFAVVGTSLVALTEMATHEQIEENERLTLLRTVNTLMPAERYDNDLFKDRIEVVNEKMLGQKTAVSVYRARKEGNPVALVLNPTAPNGYGGSIKLLIAIYQGGRIAGVRVISHKETPGLGDRIDIERSNWIEGFDGHSLNSLSESQWKVRKDGGHFDQFTGATITPRAIVMAVHKALLFYQQQGEALFLEPPLVNEEEQHEERKHHE